MWLAQGYQASFHCKAGIRTWFSSTEYQQLLEGLSQVLSGELVEISTALYMSTGSFFLTKKP